jgi:hypothetical protein
MSRHMEGLMHSISCAEGHCQYCGFSQCECICHAEPSLAIFDWDYNLTEQDMKDAGKSWGLGLAWEATR